ncbi:FdhF/YdeP family oxidoreductase [Mycolicibacterium brumae]|uniref:Formate dehydrogenase n=1 Tax=Mycolicibacterium brumae TaxID=85968 RepID=A0A2G5P8T4_9MYCO|nr:FdhF/YdeP family oxidoreductase [Mycolicibacterium brumae]MCV7193928.1 FdhF/YdeP family oxidoreductase [Mycolicibacterium brumae]PIB74696.1 formate dehydrogenase [Mycolicibacterium brumae]UWW08087.1 FdhF/YdeP family oxidoreductase [Mycolicibacterium brumae]
MSRRPRQGGYGPNTDREWSQKTYHHPAAAWGAALSVGKVILTQREPIAGPLSTLQMNHPITGYDCPGCAWPDDQHGLRLDICENGVKHVTWEMTRKRVGPWFFAAHTVSELAEWTDFELENAGRLTDPMVYDADLDRYVPISWDAAFAMIGEELRALPTPDAATFYTSGRLSNESSYIYQLFMREFGTNNMPDCSNMCHEASGRALGASIGTGKGTTSMQDWAEADLLFLLGVNAASNAPRMLTALAKMVRSGAQVVHVNPLVEIASTKTIVPHDIVDMALFKSHRTGSWDLQVAPGGDMALMRAIAKVVFEAAATDPAALDRDFLAEHTVGFDEYRALVEATEWDELVTASGLSEAQLRRAGQLYLAADKTIISWCLGVAQHEHAVDMIREFMNVLLLRGNIGRPGAGPAPVRGHSNVQGNRTCGINHHSPAALLDALDAHHGITSPRTPGLDTVNSIEAMHRGDVRVFIALGGNFVLAAPDTDYTAAALSRCSLTVQVSTKLNRSHLVHGRKALILPCLGRTEVDIQRDGPQGQTVEDAMSMVHVSYGKKQPASEALRSEPEIIARMARATLPQSKIPWESYIDNYDRIRDDMAVVLPGFAGFNELIKNPTGFRIPQPARERVFTTASGKAQFSHAPLATAAHAPEPDMLVLQTMRSHDQWNTTIYANNDRYRGVKNIRELIFMNAADMAERGIADGSLVDIVSTSKDGSQRELRSYRAIAYNTPKGSAAGYMPEMNVLIGHADYSAQSDQPLAKSIHVRVTPARASNGGRLK